jgi:hypothetical protein
MYVCMYVSSAYFSTEISQGIINVVFREFIEYPYWLLLEAVLHMINVIVSCGMNVQNSDLTPAAS